MNIRLKTCLIVRRGNEYLVGYNYFMGKLNWSSSHYDAWRTRNVKTAKAVARRTGGELMLFNPVAGQLSEYGGCKCTNGKRP